MVLLPTPPLPEPTAITLLAARPIWPIFSGGRTCSTTRTLISVSAGSLLRRSCSASRRVSSQRGPAQVVRPSETSTRRSSIAISPI